MGEPGQGRFDAVGFDGPRGFEPEGVAEAEQIRPDVRVVLTSAYSEEMLTPLTNRSKIRGFIRKPFQFATLEQTLRNALTI